jgi:16S rRNA (adenine1518-N6/adenine1519-N6)-dimethyltransferase
VADRIASAPGTKAYGTLSVWCQVHGRVADKVLVSSEAFYPRPKVRSAVLKIELFPEPLVSADTRPALRGLIRSAFGQRRKTLANALTGWLTGDRQQIESFLRAERVDPRRRGETLRVEEFIRVAQAAKRHGMLRAGC